MNEERSSSEMIWEEASSGPKSYVIFSTITDNYYSPRQRLNSWLYRGYQDRERPH